MRVRHVLAITAITILGGAPVGAALGAVLVSIVPASTGRRQTNVRFICTMG